MPQITYQGKPPSSEQFQKDLQDAHAQANPVDDLIDLWQELQNFEQKYELTSEEFYRKYQAGQQGDDEYCMLWAALYEMFNSSKRLIEKALMRAALVPEMVDMESVKKYEYA